MANVLLYYLIVINAVTFFVYGIDKAASKRGKSQTRLSFSGRKQARPKVKLRRGGRQSPLRNKEITKLLSHLIIYVGQMF